MKIINDVKKELVKIMNHVANQLDKFETIKHVMETLKYGEGILNEHCPMMKIMRRLVVKRKKHM